MLILLLLACVDDADVPLGQGEASDARLIADAFTWYCEDRSDTGAGGTLKYEGTWDFNISLAYAPDTMDAIATPSGGCENGLDLFPVDAGKGALDIPDVTAPAWTNGDFGGELPRVGTGYYEDGVVDDQDSCQTPEALFGSGIELTNAGVFSGASTPNPGATELVTLDVDPGPGGLEFGQQVTGTFDPSGWDSTWYQLRREAEGSLIESVTCDTTGSSGFTIDETAWGELSSVVAADVTNLYVGFQNTATLETTDGEKVHVVTRMMHTFVVN